MAYRSEHPTELCARCDHAATDACVRCGQLYCEGHKPPPDRRCDPCEVEYLTRETGKTQRLIVVILVAAGIGAFFGVMGIHAARNGFIRGPYAHMVPLVLYVSLAVLVGAFAGAPLYRRYLRGRFLSERKRASK